jgi:hypothetical protein
MSGICLVLVAMNNRTLGPDLVAIHGILISVMAQYALHMSGARQSGRLRLCAREQSMSDRPRAFLPLFPRGEV